MAYVPDWAKDTTASPYVPDWAKDADTSVAPRDRTWGEAASDIGSGIAKGGLGMATGLANLADLATFGAVSGITKGVGGLVDRALGGTGEGYTLQEGANRIDQGLAALESEPLRQRRQQMQERLSGVGTQGGLTGGLEKFWAGAKETATDPVLLAQMAAEQVPLLATMGAGTVGTAAKAGAAARLGGATAEAAQQLGARAATRANIGFSGALGAGYSSQQAAQDVLRATPEQMAQSAPYQELRQSGLSDRDARAELARQAGYPAALVAGPISALTARLTAPMETAAFLGQLPRGVGPVVGAMGREALEEIPQESSEQVGSNLGAIRAGLDRSVWEGVPEAAGQAGVAGGLLGGALGGVHLARSSAAPQATTSEPPPAGPTPAPTAPQAPELATAPEGLNEPLPDTGPVSRAANQALPTPLSPPTPETAPLGQQSPETTPIQPEQSRPEPSILPLVGNGPESAGAPAPTAEPAQQPVGPITPPEILDVQEEVPAETKAKAAPPPPVELSTGPGSTDSSLSTGESSGSLAAPSTLSGPVTQEIPLSRLRLSEDVPQFKSEANPETGVVEPLGGKYERTGTAPIIVWERANGQQEVISGRHRLDLARRSGEQTIPAQVLREADGFNARQAANLDAELNIRDGQGKVKDYVQYFQGSGLQQTEAESRGLLARAAGQRGYRIANDGGAALVAAHRADVLTDDAAFRIAQTAPRNERIQAVGIQAVQDGNSIATATNLMQAVKSLGMADATADMFGFDDSALRQAETMARIANRHQRQLGEQLAAVQGAAKRPEQARKLGVDVADPEAVRAKIAEIKAERDAWETWSTNPDLVAQIRQEAEARNPRASAATGTATNPAETARALAAHPDVQRLGDRITVVERQAALRPELQPKDGGPVKAVIDRGKIVLVGEHWTAEDLARMEGVLQHEGGVHLARDSGFYDPSVQAAGKVLRAVGLKSLAGEASWNDVTRQFQALVKNQNSTAQRAHELARDALGEAADANPDRLAEEALGYLAELNPKHSLIRRLAATVKAVLYRMGVRVTLDDAALVALARIGLRREIQAARPHPQADAVTVAALRLLRQDADLFQNKPAQSRDLTGIFQEIDPGIRVTRDMTPTELHAVGADSGTALTMPDGAEAFVMRRKNAVWVDASQLRGGRSRGSTLYAAVADYAHNNGLVFQGDPAGLSDIAKLRRTENMLASAIKHGTTEHLWPHEKQGIAWTGDNDLDFQALIQKSMDNILEQVPDLKAVRYDFDQRRFINTDTGRAVGEADFTALADTPGARAAQAGSTTLRRTALLNTLAQGESGTSGTPGTGRGRALLGDVVRELRAGVAGGPLRGVFYSRPHAWADNLPAEVGSMADKIGAEPKGLLERLAESKATLPTRLRAGLIDRFTRLLELDRERFGRDVTDTHTELSAWVAAKMSKSPAGALEGVFFHGRLKWEDGALNVQETKQGLAKALEPIASAGELNRFWQWIIAHRSERLLSEGRERLFTPAEIAAGKTLNGGQMAGGASRNAVYRQAFARYVEIQKSVLNVAQQAGLFDAQQRAQWEHDFYLPFYRVIENEGEVRGPSTGGGKLVRQKAFETLKGGAEKLGDPLQNILRNWHHLIDASLKNRAASLALDTAEHLGIAQPVPEAQTDKNSVWVMKAGQKTHYNVSDPLTLDALSALHAPLMDGAAIRALAAAKRALTLGVTISPAFKITNLLRDSIAALAVSRLDANLFKLKPLTNPIQGFLASKEGGATQAALLAGGGTFRFGSLLEGDSAAAARSIAGFKPDTVLDSPAHFKGMFDTLKSGLDAWNRFGDRLETANRAALYEQLRGEGKTHLQAALAARDLMDFSQSGAWPATRFLINMVPFMNARIQGLDVLYRKGFQPLTRAATGRASGGEKQQAIRFAATTFVVGLASALLYLSYKDDEEFKAREQWDRDAYWWFKAGDKAWRIPKPFEVGALGTIAERLVEQIVDQEATGALFAERVKAMLGQTFAFDPTPQLVKPLMEVMENRSRFSGRPIETMDLERLSPELRRRYSTSALAIGASQAANTVGVGVSPVQIEHLIRGYFGWIGAQSLLVGDLMARPVMGLPERPAKQADIPLVGDLIQRFAPDGRSSRYLTEFHDQAKQIRQIAADYRLLQRLEDPDALRALVARHGKALAQAPAYEQVAQALADLGQAERHVGHDRRLSGLDKQARIDEITQRKRELARQALAALR